MNFLVIFLMDQAAFSIDEMGGGGGGQFLYISAFCRLALYGWLMAACFPHHESNMYTTIKNIPDIAFTL